MDAKKILFSAKQSYNKAVAENRELKAYTENLKQHMQKQQVQSLEKQKNYYQYKKPTQKKFVYQKESEPEFEKEEQVEFESEQIEKEPKIKKAPSKKRPANSSNIYDYINTNAKRNEW